MTNDLPTAVDAASCLAEWEKALVARDFRRGLLIALRGYEWALSKADEVHRKMFLYFLKLAIDELFKVHLLQAENVRGQQSDAAACSFCGKSFEAARLVHGANAAICSECIQMASKMTSK